MGLPFLPEAPKDLLERLCLNLDWQAALQDERIFREGDVANHLFIVVRGTVLIIHSDKADRSEWDVLTKYETGPCFGEIALLIEGARRTAVVHFSPPSTSREPSENSKRWLPKVDLVKLIR